jgi:hypothetical protein
MTSLFRTLSIGAALLAFAAICDASTVVNAAETSSQATPPKHQVRKATDIGARRHDRRHDYAVARGDDGYYEDRPVYYRPYPYALPAPFFLGLAFSPPW